jgi:hypothetical protein|tara:strand:- start:2125 stop:2319 length:195 start_codon:yes stop_codon:yes gene_type:complete
MDLPIDKKEFDEIVDALCSEHVDIHKREYRYNLYYKMKTIQKIMDENPGGPYKKIAREEFGFVI